MPTSDYELKALFAEPIFRINIADAISPTQVEYLKNLKMVENESNLISENTYIFKEPELASLATAVQDVLNVYAKEVMGIAQSLEVTQSWTLRNDPGVPMHAHAHSHSIISGSIYYCELPEPPSRMVFYRHKCHRQIDLQPTVGTPTVYNTNSNRISPNHGEMILFSSELTHMVEPNTSDMPRHSIAFNTFVRGRLGGYRNISELYIS